MCRDPNKSVIAKKKNAVAINVGLRVYKLLTLFLMNYFISSYPTRCCKDVADRARVLGEYMITYCGLRNKKQMPVLYIINHILIINYEYNIFLLRNKISYAGFNSKQKCSITAKIRRVTRK